MKRFFLNILLVLVSAGCGTAPATSWIVPPRALVAFAEPTQTSESVSLLLIAGGGIGCDEVSDLETTISHADAVVLIRIVGFSRKEGRRDGCPAVLTPATATIRLSRTWLNNKRATLVFELGAHSNRYVLHEDSRTVTLTPESVSNVLSAPLGIDPGTNAVPIEVPMNPF